MRADADAERVRALARELGRVAREDVTIYLTGGATAVLQGWRRSTVDVDMRVEPDSDNIMRRIATVKNDLDVNVELASPPDFIPELPGWREIEPGLFRYPAIDAEAFRSKVERALGDEP